MRTLDEQAASVDSMPPRLKRDLGLLWRLLGMGVQYFSVGARIRKDYRAKEAAGETYWVDE